jgi:uncharacterized protein involved in response to NO
MNTPFKDRAVFSYAFRPLFALLALYGLLVIPYWVLAWSGHIALPSITKNPALWHGHEMLFGFTAAAIAGFLLTAVANWTQRPPIAGLPLLLLCGFWLLARLAWCLPCPAALPLAALFDIVFDALLLAQFSRELVATKNQRNAKVAGVLALYTLINAGFYASLLTGWPDPSRWLIAALYLVILLITIIGGRIIPLFTGNWLKQQGSGNTPNSLPPTFNRIDLIAIVATALFMAMALAKLPGAGITGIVAALLQALRLARWQGWRTTRQPLLWSLHIGYAWVIAGLFLNGLALTSGLPFSAGLHAFSTGAIAGLILAVSGRVALGHTGRPLTSHPLLTVAFVAINIAALARVAAALFPTLPLLLWIAAGAWLLALTSYCVRNFPMLLFPAPKRDS